MSLAQGDISMFTAKNTLNAKILVKSDAPQTWSQKTYLMRFQSRAGNHMMCTVTGDTYGTFKDAEEGRIYDFLVPGTCVKRNVNGLKHGITSPYEIVIKFPIKFSLAKEGWVIPIDFEGVPFDDVGQRESDTIVDIIGRVVAVKSGDPASTLRKSVVQLQSGALHENLELLGDKSKVKLRANDILAAMQNHRIQPRARFHHDVPHVHGDQSVRQRDRDGS